MKKRIMLMFVVFILGVTGCGKMSQKELEDAKLSMRNYIRNHMSASWKYEENKVSIDDNLVSNIKIYNVVDITDCIYEAKESFVSLSENADSISNFKSVNIYCEYIDEKIGYISVENIAELTADNYEDKISVFDNTNNKIEISKEFYDEQKNLFISKCNSYSYKDIFRNSDIYLSEYAVFTGEVVQVMDNKEFYDVRINVTKGDYDLYTDTVYASIPKNYFNGRILEQDIITLYGRLHRLTTYTSIFGQEITIPTIYVRYAELNN